MENNNPAKFAFFYVLSLISLVSLATAVGTILFQIINKNVLDVLNEVRGSYSSSSLRFAISSIIISAPVYYFVVNYINKSLFKKELDKDSEIRKWLSYLILLISFVVISGWLIGAVFNFLNGEITLKFILKALVSVGIAATIFSYYFYDLKKKDFVGVKDKVVSIYFYSTLVVVLASLVSAFLFVESPSDARKRNIDNEVLTRLTEIDSSLQNFYGLNKSLPEGLTSLLSGPNTFLRETSLYDPETKVMFEYKKLDELKYEICAEFRLSNKEANADYDFMYINENWLHDSGRQCFQKAINDLNDFKPDFVR